MGKHRWGAAFLVALLLLPLFGGAAETLLKNGGFEQAANGQPVDWSSSMWNHSPGVTEAELSGGAYEGEFCAMVRNISPNDARFEQTVKVKPNTIYRISGMVRAEGCLEGFKGANLSVLNLLETSPDLHETDGEWVQLELYGVTGKKQKELTVMARLGGYGSENSGTAWFDNITVEAVDELPPDAPYIGLLATPTPEKPPREPIQLGELTPWLLMALGLLFAGVGAVLARWRLSASAAPLAKEKPRYGVLGAVLLGGLLLRLGIAWLVPGYGTDMNCFGLWAERLAEVSPWNFYGEQYFCDYPPGYMYVLWLNGGLMRLFDVRTGAPLASLITKLPPIVFDMVSAALLYQLSRKTLGERGAVALAALYAVCPVALINGAAWGQADTLMALLLALAVAQVIKDRWDWALPIYMIAVLVKPQALLFGPLGLLALALAWWQDKAIGKRFAIGMAALLGTAAVLVLPFWGGQPWDWVLTLYGKTLSSYPHATVNAANLFYLLGGNWADVTAPVLGLPWSVWGTVFMVLIFALVGVLYWRGKDKALLYELSALLLFGLFVFGVKMHERYLFPVVLLTLLAFVQRRDWRTLAFAFGVSLTALVNIGMVLAYDHLINENVWVGNLLAGLNMLLFGLAVWTAVDHCLRGVVRPLPARAELPAEAAPQRHLAMLQAPKDYRLHLSKVDWGIMLGVTLAYAVLAFWNLGSTTAPQSEWRPNTVDEVVTFDLGEVRDFQLYYYGGISGDSFFVETSEDGQDWSESELAKLDGGECFRWLRHAKPRYDEDGLHIMNDEGEYQWEGSPQWLSARYLRLTPDGMGLSLFEVAFHNADGGLWPVQNVTTNQAEGQYLGSRLESRADELPLLTFTPALDYQPTLLLDEQNTVPEIPTFFNGTYFDEIYHARTAYEHLHNIHTFEWTHPPLGKVLIMVGIELFGMTPFGWRCMGALIGVLMLPAMYLLAKQLWKRTDLATFAMGLMTLDLMHYTQTRIATIDSYPVLFIMLMYWLMFRYMQMSFYHQPLKKTLMPLALSGLCFGLAIASKWIGLYAGVGLAALFFYTLWRRAAEYASGQTAGGEAAERTKVFPKAALVTLGWCVIWFLIVPALIYYFSYYWQFKPDGGLTWKRFWDMQQQMYGYHSQLKATHSFESKWWQWPIIAKPMYYYAGPRQGNRVSSILSFGNPAVWWGGLVALIAVLGTTLTQLLQRLLDGAAGRLRAPSEKHRAWLATGGVLLIGFASQYLPWVLVPRSTYIYHYFASVPFIILCMAQCAAWVGDETPGQRRFAWIAMGAWLLVSLVLFIGFFPYASGYPMTVQWAEAMRWFPGWLWY